MVGIHWTRYSSTQALYPLASRLIPWLSGSAIVLGGIGLFVGLVVAPTDFQQGDAYRIIFVHVPAAWMSMVLYIAMAFWAAIGMGLNTKSYFLMASAIAPTGAVFTLLALLTGAMWGKPTWGTWWAWDARLTSELILLFLFLGRTLLHAAIDDRRRADRAAAIFSIVGVVNVPIIYFSVQWWNTLHQGASVSMTAAPKMAALMVTAMLIMTAAFWLYSLAVILARLRCEIVEREGRPGMPEQIWRSERAVA
jgi:heme exporter protein C